jgi:hypothetical protein
MYANEHKYYYFNLCLFVFICGFVYPWSPLAPPKAGKPLFSFLFFERSRCFSFYVYLQVVPKAT